MPWKVQDIVQRRTEFVMACMQQRKSMVELCAEFGISRKVGYKWLQRFYDGGVPALADRSRAPQRHPSAVSAEVLEALVALRHQHMSWGPKKLLTVLRQQQPDVRWPAQSTVSVLLKRRGLVEARRRRTRTPHSTQPLAAATEPNLVWATDFKGQFRVGGTYCHPLTITDGYSRYLLRCQGLDAERSEPVQRAFEDVFREYGLPLRIRSDNGAPFASCAVGGLSRLSVWWVRLGILPERIRPGQPQDNGRHERMHRTLKCETAKPPRSAWDAQQEAFDRFRQEYNHLRPHEALGQRTPASLYQASPRLCPEELGDPEYPEPFAVRRVDRKGAFGFRSRPVYLGPVLAGQAVGIEEIDEDKWQLWFGPVYLGLLTALARARVEFFANKPVSQE